MQVGAKAMGCTHKRAKVQSGKGCVCMGSEVLIPHAVLSAKKGYIDVPTLLSWHKNVGGPGSLHKRMLLCQAQRKKPNSRFSRLCSTCSMLNMSPLPGGGSLAQSAVRVAKTLKKNTLHSCICTLSGSVAGDRSNWHSLKMNVLSLAKQEAAEPYALFRGVRGGGWQCCTSFEQLSPGSLV